MSNYNWIFYGIGAIFVMSILIGRTFGPFQWIFTLGFFWLLSSLYENHIKKKEEVKRNDKNN